MSTKSAAKENRSGDALADELEGFFDRVRAALDWEITAAKSLVTAAHAEKTAAANALTELQAQLKSTQSQLDAAMKDLQRASTRVGLDREIAAARKTLDALKAETVEATKALEALNKQRVDAERQLVALGNEAQRMIAIRTEGEAVMAAIKTKLLQVQLGNRP
jgi:chromosome segregation ATPase